MICLEKKYFVGQNSLKRRFLGISGSWVFFLLPCMLMAEDALPMQQRGEILEESDPSAADGSRKIEDVAMAQTLKATPVVENSAAQEALNTTLQNRTQTSHAPIAYVGARGYLSTVSGLVFVYPDEQTGAVIQEIFVKEGDRVQRGQLMAKMSHYPLREIDKSVAEQEFNLAKSNLKIAENKKNTLQKQWDRNQKLRSSRTISDQELEKIQKEYIESKIDVEKMGILLNIAQQKFNLSHIRMMQSVIRSPMDGNILVMHGKVGERVSNEEGLLMMADLNQMEIVAEVHENDISKISLGQKAEISFPNQGLTMMAQVTYKAGFIHSNRLRDSDPKGSQDLRVVEVRLSLNSEDAKKVKDFLRMHVDVRFFPENKTQYDTSITLANEARAL